MLMIDLILFGPIGLTLWAVQMLWVPFFAAGVINGIGHSWGYRNFAPNNASQNIVPWGLLICGEELHNNHHAYATSAKLSSQWWEFDLGWLYIRALETLGLARVRRVAPKIRFDPTKRRCDAETLRAVITHRYQVLATFARCLKQTALEEIRALQARATLGLRESRALQAVQHGLQRDAENLPEPERVALEEAPCQHGAAHPLRDAPGTGGSVESIHRLEGAVGQPVGKLVPARRGERHPRTARVFPEAALLRLTVDVSEYRFHIGFDPRYWEQWN